MVPDKQRQNHRVSVLLVDDSPANLLALETILDGPEYRLVKANSGLEALLCMAAEEFAVVLLDVMMPDLDGFEVARRAKLQELNATTPIIFVTAMAREGWARMQGFALGAADYLLKPLSEEEVRAKVAVFAELQRSRRALRLLNLELEEKAQARARDLAHSNERFRLFVEGVKEYGLLQLNAAGNFITWNVGAERLLGYRADEIIGLPFRAIFTDEDVADGAAEGELEIARLHGRADDTRWHRRKDNSRFWAHGVTTALYDEDGVLRGFAKILRDYTDEKKAQEEVERARRIAVEANHAKTVFLANMSHELRTPLNSIVGFADFLTEKTVTEAERQEFVLTIRRNCSLLLQLIDDILDLSRVEAGKLVIEKRPCSLPGILGDVELLLRPLAREKGIGLEFSSVGPMPDEVVTDPVRLQQVLLNVINNALKFSLFGTVKVVVTATGGEEASGGSRVVTITVEDHGRGIKLEQQGTLFQPFAQGEASTNHKYGGSGLGLALSRKLARGLGGDVVLLRSAPGQGSTFAISFESGGTEARNADARGLLSRGLAAPSLDLRGMEALANQARGVESSDGSQATPVSLQRLAGGRALRQAALSDEAEEGRLAGLKILVAEDSLDNQRLIARMLNRDGAEVAIASNGREAITAALGGHYDAVLMDIQMPVCDGYEAAAELRRLGYARPIIALTAHAMEEERRRAIAAGCNGHVPKPIDRRQLVGTMIQLTKPAAVPAGSQP